MIDPLLDFSLASSLLSLAVIAWGVVCGAAVYEHVAVIPEWAKAPPASLAMWHGDYPVRAERFWIGVHPVVLVLLGGALAVNWSGPARDGIAATLIGYVLVLLATFAWYVPELLKLTRNQRAEIPAPEWRTRSRRWELASVARTLFMLALAVPLSQAFLGR